MKPLFLYYPNCSTSRKAMKWLQQNNIDVDYRDIAKENPGKEELIKWIALSGKPLTKFFNTSGLKYRELNMKEKMNTLSADELTDLLSSDGMLVKRPLLVWDKVVLTGFKEVEWEKALL